MRYDIDSNKLWRFISDFIRGGQSLVASEILEKANSIGLELTQDDLLDYILSSHQETFFPGHVAFFIASVLKTENCNHIVDPLVVRPSLLRLLSSELKPTKSTGLVLRQDIYKLLMALDTNQKTNWQIDELRVNQCDVIVSSPPWNAKLNGFGEHQDAELDSVLKASKILGDTGRAVFVLGGGFFFRHKRIYQLLSENSMFVSSIVALSPGTFAPCAQIGGLLVFFERQPVDKVFVGELTREDSAINALLKNLKTRKAGKAPPLGMLIEPNTFSTYSKLISQQNLEKTVRTCGMPPTPLSDVSMNIVAGKHNEEDGGFIDQPNCVYLPKIGNSPAVTSVGELRIKAQNYYQIHLNADKCLPAYLAGFFNSQLGLKVREATTTGTTIPSIPKSALSQMNVYIPDLKTQEEVVAADSTISNLTTSLEAYGRKIWERPKAIKAIRSEVEKYVPKEDLATWIDTLPFPLASILWLYETPIDSKEKIEALFHFFEALAQYNVTILLSAFSSDPKFYSDYSSKWLEGSSEFGEWYLTPSFGNWVRLLERLSKSTRRLLDDENSKDRCLSVFSDIDTDLLSAITSKKVVSVLDKVSKYRNSWKGHGGRIGPKQANESLAYLETELSEIRSEITDYYSRGVLVSPKNGELSSGIWTFKVKLLVGKTHPFVESKISSIEGLDSQFLYFIPEGSLRPVKLIPLFRLMESPKTAQNACYFFNRREGAKGTYRWVSYHFEAEAELCKSNADAPIEAVFDLFKLPDISITGT